VYDSDLSIGGGVGCTKISECGAPKLTLGDVEILNVVDNHTYNDNGR
jgi:hypothetical protein